MTAGLTSPQGGEGAQRCCEEMDFRNAGCALRKTKNGRKRADVRNTEAVGNIEPKKRGKKDRSMWIPALLIMRIDCQADCNLRQSSSSPLPSTLVWHGRPQPAQNQSVSRYGQLSWQ
ncbi:hypothetical protein PAMA_008402 [Pampus argenteus]